MDSKLPWAILRQQSILRLLYRRVLKGGLGHTSGSPFHAQCYLLNQIHSFWLVHCVTQWLLSINWLIGGVIFLPRLAVVFLSNDCLFSYCVYSVFPKYLYANKSGQKWQKMVKSGQKWQKMAKRGKKWPKVAKSGQKWPKVAKSGQKWAEFSEYSRNPSFRLEKSSRNALKTRLSLAGSWISTVHTMMNAVFCFLPDVPVWKRFDMVILGQLIDKLREKQILTRLEPFRTG